MGRFYPASVPTSAHEATQDRFAIRRLGTCGEGLVTLVDIPARALAFQFWGTLRSDQTLFTLQERPGVYVHDPWVMGKVIHCCEPNCDVDVAARTFVANRPIAAGELITMDYETTEDELYRAFHCKCGAPSCRGYIAGARVPKVVRFAPRTPRVLSGTETTAMPLGVDS